MPSKKAVFESRDPSSLADSSLDAAKRNPETPIEAPQEILDDKFSLEPLEITDTDPVTGDTGEASNQVAEKASFYTPDAELDTEDSDNTGKKKKYMGVERRRTNRRSGNDRRNDVRFDLDKNDRRQNQGRREDDHTPKYW